MRAFLVRMPSGDRYWTVIGEAYEVAPVADQYLRELRLGQDRAESTTKAYAQSVALYLRWCSLTGRDWTSAARDLGLFVTWLKFTPSRGNKPVVFGPGSTPVRCESRINQILVATRGFLAFAVLADAAPRSVMDQIYEIGDTADLPIAARGEDSPLRYRLRARHRLHEPDPGVDRASDEEIIALMRVCLSARDRLIVLLLTRAGLRRGEAAGLRREDLHLLPDNRRHDCTIDGAHLHVIRRPNSNGAWAKSRRNRAVPLDFLVVRALDLYLLDRDAESAAADCDFLLVNLYRAPLGAPMPPDAFNELFDRLSRRAGLTRVITPHQGRHAFASNLADSGAVLDEIQTLLGHACPSSSEPYLHPSVNRLRSAIESVATPRDLARTLS
ncbi:site-specific integrase [Nocardia salmonicida]|uniref:tyrosine-type recombinase/integrase n=1 Tax=Nocardia salmonicida TaxID=53431 RepID=UPI003408F412